MNLKYLTLFLFSNIALSGILPATAQEIEESSYTAKDLIASAENIKKLFDLEKHDYDDLTGDEINQVCAGCHDEFGMGGSDGKYPRIAGLPVPYIIKEIVFFRERHRPNIAMVEHVEERQLSNAEVMDIAIYLNKIKLNNRLSIIDETAPDFDAYARLQEAKSVIQIGKTAGDIEKGKKLYKKECKSCHGKKGEGDQEDGVPLLAGQYQNYLQRQINQYIKGKRLHDEDDPEEEFLKSFSKEQMKDIFAYISILDD